MGKPSWKRLKLKYLVDLAGDRAESRPEEFRYIGLEDIRPKMGELTNAQEEIGEESIEGISTVNLFQKGDILFGKLRPYLAKAWVCEFDGACTTEALVLRPRQEILPRFLLRIILSDEFIRKVDETTFGSKMPRADWQSIGDIEIERPGILQQASIAEFIDERTNEIDALVAEEQKLLGTLAEKRRALITHAVTQGLDPKVPMRDSGIPWLGKIPTHWEVKKLKYLADVRGGITLGKDYTAANLKEYPYLRVANVQDGYLNLETIATVFVPDQEAKSCILQYGDVLMNEGGDIDKLGRGCVWRGEVENCLHQNHVFCVRPFAVHYEWLNVWTSTNVAKSYFEHNAKRATNLASISGSNIKELVVPLPPEEEQRQIISFIDAEFGKLDRLKNSAEKMIALLQERRSALISAAVTGQLEIGDLN